MTIFKKYSRLLLTIYLILLTWAILFKFATRLGALPLFMHYRHINWVPFSDPLIVNGKIVLEEMLFNLLAFVPFGFLLSLREKHSLLTIVVRGFLLSLTYEVLQYLLTLGMTDTTDLLLNTLGSIVGYFGFKWCKTYLGAKTI